MKCPIDQNPLQITERQGVEIDYCPACRGVWLDRGELDKILDRVDGGRGDSDFGRGQKGHSESRGGHGNYGKRRKESVFGELFDF